jgi:hypothetical protein
VEQNEPLLLSSLETPQFEELARYFGTLKAHCWVCGADDWMLHADADGSIQPSFVRRVGRHQNAPIYHVAHLVIECQRCFNLWFVGIRGIQRWLASHPEDPTIEVKDVEAGT